MPQPRSNRSKKPQPPPIRKEGTYTLPRWAWVAQVLLFHVLATGIVIYELAFAKTFHYEALIFAGWLYLIPSAVNGTGLFKLLRGG